MCIYIYIQYIYIIKYTVYIYIVKYTVYIYIQLYSHCILMSPRIFTFILYTFIHLDLNLSFAIMLKSCKVRKSLILHRHFGLPPDLLQIHPVSALTHLLADPNPFLLLGRKTHRKPRFRML